MQHRVLYTGPSALCALTCTLGADDVDTNGVKEYERVDQNSDPTC